MRRKDKEIKDKTEIESIISRCDVCRIAVCENNSPYIVPVCFGYKDNWLYFHSATDGKKIEIIRRNNRVCFEFDIYEDLIKSEKPCDWGVKYYSVVGYGKALFIDDIEGKRKALDIITEHYAGNLSEHQNYPINNISINNISIIKIEIESITGKKSG